jgi:hypothetical protein
MSSGRTAPRDATFGPSSSYIFATSRGSGITARELLDQVRPARGELPHPGVVRRVPGAYSASITLREVQDSTYADFGALRELPNRIQTEVMGPWRACRVSC